MMMAADPAHYLANKPSGATVAYLVVAITVFVLAAGLAVTDRNYWRALVAFGLGWLALALLVPG